MGSGGSPARRDVVRASGAGAEAAAVALGGAALEPGASVEPRSVALVAGATVWAPPSLTATSVGADCVVSGSVSAVTVALDGRVASAPSSPPTSARATATMTAASAASTRIGSKASAGCWEPVSVMCCYYPAGGPDYHAGPDDGAPRLEITRLGDVKVRNLCACSPFRCSICRS